MEGKHKEKPGKIIKQLINTNLLDQMCKDVSAVFKKYDLNLIERIFILEQMTRVEKVTNEKITEQIIQRFMYGENENSFVG